jgi:hypothetical protein
MPFCLELPYANYNISFVIHKHHKTIIGPGINDRTDWVVFVLLKSVIQTAFVPMAICYFHDVLLTLLNLSNYITANGLI